jgi:TatA/E family protein of Tat protein translocase
MPNIGPVELIIILVIALLILGPGKLPDVGAALGKSIREFRKASSDVQDAVKLDASPLPTEPSAPTAPSAPATPAAPEAAAPAEAVAQPPTTSVAEATPATPTPTTAAPASEPTPHTN